MNSKVFTLVRIALVAAIMCILGPISFNIPISDVPISLGVLAVFLGAYVNGWKLGMASCLLYVLIGLAGLPVFSNFTGGAAKLFGPTGGYIVGYFFIALIAGLFIEKFEKKFYMHAIGMVLGTICCYTLGTAWFCFQSGTEVGAALMLCVIPFIPADIIKMILAIAIGIPVRDAVKKINR